MFTNALLINRCMVQNQVWLGQSSNYVVCSNEGCTSTEEFAEGMEQHSNYAATRMQKWSRQSWMMREAWSKTVHMHMQQNGYTNRANNNNGGGCPNEIKMSSKEEHAARFLHSFFVLLPFLTFRAAIFHEIAIITHFFNLMLSTPVMPQYAQQQQCIIFSHTRCAAEPLIYKPNSEYNRKK